MLLMIRQKISNLTVTGKIFPLRPGRQIRGQALYQLRHKAGLYSEAVHLQVQSNLDISNSDILNSANSKLLSESKIQFDCFLKP